jgi:hypothetical protein
MQEAVQGNDQKTKVRAVHSVHSSRSFSNPLRCLVFPKGLVQADHDKYACFKASKAKGQCPAKILIGRSIIFDTKQTNLKRILGGKNHEQR